MKRIQRYVNRNQRARNRQEINRSYLYPDPSIRFVDISKGLWTSSANRRPERRKRYFPEFRPAPGNVSVHRVIVTKTTGGTLEVLGKQNRTRDTVSGRSQRTSSGPTAKFLRRGVV